MLIVTILVILSNRRGAKVLFLVGYRFGGGVPLAGSDPSTPLRCAQDDKDGKLYTSYHGQELRTLPAHRAVRLAREFLEWHNEAAKTLEP